VQASGRRQDTPQPTVPPPQPEGLAPALDRNIQALVQRRKAEEKSASLQERIADSVTRFAGSMTFVYLHLAAFGFWISANVGLLPFLTPWDPFLVVLAMIASVEAIFLSTFVLISQNRMAAAAAKRADLDLQTSLLTEHEVTKLIVLVHAIATRLEVATEVDGEVGELEKNIAPETVLDRIESVDRSQ
jgi:uncharacterized membrane protein